MKRLKLTILPEEHLMTEFLLLLYTQVQHYNFYDGESIMMFYKIHRTDTRQKFGPSLMVIPQNITEARPNSLKK